MSIDPKILIACAEAAHECNRVFCAANGDTSQVPWPDAPEWQHISSMNGVRLALKGATPEQLHEAWCADKRESGWVYGEKKDPEAKSPTHSCLVPYNELPTHQRAKDTLFQGVVRTMAASLGYMPPSEENGVVEKISPETVARVQAWRRDIPQAALNVYEEMKRDFRNRQR